MFDKLTTSTGILFAGIGTMAGNTSAIQSNFHYCVPSHELYAIELEYNSPEQNKYTIDLYVEQNYKTTDLHDNDYSTLEYKFMDIVQNFAEKQIELENDLIEVMDELFLANAQPTRKRF